MLAPPQKPCFMSPSRPGPSTSGTPEIVTLASKVAYRKRSMTVGEDQILSQDGTNGTTG